MKLTTRSRYGLRAITYIAANDHEHAISISELAKELKLSDHYLEQLLRILKNAGFVKSVRGVNGGYLLNKPAEQVTVYDLLNVLEGPMWLAECTVCGECPGGNTNCPTRLIMRRMSQAIEKVTRAENLKEMAELYKAV